MPGQSDSKRSAPLRILANRIHAHFTMLALIASIFFFATLGKCWRPSLLDPYDGWSLLNSLA